jgi:peroxiredoxin family protein
MKGLNVPTVRELPGNDGRRGGAKLYACKMSFDMFGLKKDGFR